MQLFSLLIGLTLVGIAWADFPDPFEGNGATSTTPLPPRTRFTFITPVNTPRRGFTNGSTLFQTRLNTLWYPHGHRPHTHPKRSVDDNTLQTDHGMVPAGRGYLFPTHHLSEPRIALRRWDRNAHSSFHSLRKRKIRKTYNITTVRSTTVNSSWKPETLAPNRLSTLRLRPEISKSIQYNPIGHNPNASQQPGCPSIQIFWSEAKQVWKTLTAVNGIREGLDVTRDSTLASLNSIGNCIHGIYNDITSWFHG